MTENMGGLHHKQMTIERSAQNARVVSSGGEAAGSMVGVCKPDDDIIMIRRLKWNVQGDADHQCGRLRRRAGSRGSA